MRSVTTPLLVRAELEACRFGVSIREYRELEARRPPDDQEHDKVATH